MFSDDEAEEDAIVNQVLDEIGIEISGKVSAKYFLTRSDLYRLLSLSVHPSDMNHECYLYTGWLGFSPHDFVKLLWLRVFQYLSHSSSSCQISIFQSGLVLHDDGFFWIYNTCSLPNYIILMNRFCFRWSRLLRLARARWNLLSGYRTRKSVNLAINDKYCMAQLCIKQYKDGGRGAVKVMFSRNELLKKWCTLFHQSLVPLSLSRARACALLYGWPMPPRSQNAAADAEIEKMLAELKS